MGTQTTDSGARASLALQAMESNASRLRQVMTRLLAEHTGLPDLIDTRPSVSKDAAQLDLQPDTVAEARKWASALGVELKVEEVTGFTPGWMYRRAIGHTEIDGVRVFVVSSESYTAREWAELKAAGQVAA